uniref:Supervillin n=1 Tax=Eptatretus burgeri TaxID=7764 RepID=A0A8C4NHM5_EPTBU
MNRKERLSRRMEGIVNETLRLGSGHPHTLLQSGQQGDLGRGDQIANGLGQLHPQKIGQTKATVVPGSSNLSTQQPSGERMIQHPLEPESQHAPPAYDLESRAERIARYKAERRRQLAEQFGINIPDDADVRSTPKRNECLNIVSPPEASSMVSTSYSLLQRPGQGSITLKMQEDYKTCACPSMKQDTVIQQASSSAVTLKDPAAHEDSADSPRLRCHQIWGHEAQVQRNMPVPLENKTSGGMEEVKLHLPLESRTCRREESRGRFLSSSLVEKHQEDFSSPNVTSMSRLSSSNYDRTSIDHSPSLDSQQAIITSSRTEEVVTHPSADTTVLSALSSSHEGRSRNGENRRLNERFHTQPITSTERQQTLYSASQQGVASTSSQPLKRANTTEIMEGGDKTDEKARMSMAAKLSLFQAMGPVPKKAAAPSNTKRQPASLAWHQRSGPSRSRDVSQECPPHKSSKVLHSPTTCRAPVALKMETTSNREPSVHMEQDTNEEPDNSRLSLVEKMALFTRLGQAISSGVAPEQRIRRSSQRFQTQPLMADVLSPNLDHSNTRASEAGSSAIKPAAWTSQHPLIGAQVTASTQQSFSSYKSIQTTCLSGDVQSSVNRQLPFTVSRNGGATLVAVPTLLEPSRQAASTFEKIPATYNSGPGRGAEEEDEEPDNSRLTLAEKMALFTQLSKGGPKTLVQRNRRSIPRFQTQPVTASEVHSASLATTSIAQVTSSVTYSQKQSSQQKIIVSGRPIQTGPVKAFKGSEGHHVPGIRAESDARETSMESPFHAWKERATIDPSLKSRTSFDHMGDKDPKQKTDSSIEQAVHVSVAAETTAPWRKGLKTREKMVDTRKQQLQSLPKFPLSNVEQLRTSPVDTVTSFKRSKHEDHGWKERVVGHIDSKETSVRLEWQRRSQEIRQQQEIHIVGQREFAPLEKSVGEGGDTREKMGNEVLKVSFRPTESLSPARASHEVQKRDSKPSNLEWHSDLHHSSHWVSITPDSQETHDKYLDMVTESSSPRLLTSIAAEHRRAIRPVRKSTRSRNPLRVLAEREDVRTDLIERGSPRRGDQTEEGLRAAEIQCSSETVSPRAKNRQTFQPLMLIQVKGRKHVQVRVVEPYVHSVGPGMCAVLVTAQSCFLWLGHEANTSEKIKATKLAAQIQHGQELGCKASVVTVLEERNIYSGDEAATFWTLLGTQHHTAPPCSPEKSTPCNEESYEHDIIATNCLFRLQGQCLVPDDKFWGKAPPHAILQTCAVLVFDFGTEIYTWIGEGVGPKSRRLAGLLAQQLWIGPYDYSTCRINPLGPWATRRGNGRPDWAVYSQIDQGRELLLFREKFLDWPGVQQEVLSKELIEEEEEVRHKKCLLT